MYHFITENQLVSFFSTYDINYYLFEPYQQGICLLIANILYIIFMVVIISVIYKILCRIIRWFS